MGSQKNKSSKLLSPNCLSYDQDKMDASEDILKENIEEAKDEKPSSEVEDVSTEPVPENTVVDSEVAAADEGPIEEDKLVCIEKKQVEVITKRKTRSQGS